MEGEEVDALDFGLEVGVVHGLQHSGVEDGEKPIVDHLHDSPEAVVFKDVIVLVVKLDVFQDDIDHAHVLPAVLDAIDQLREQLEIKILPIDQLADHHTLHVIERSSSALQQRSLDLLHLGWLQVHYVFVAFEERIQGESCHLAQSHMIVRLREDISEIDVRERLFLDAL